MALHSLVWYFLSLQMVRWYTVNQLVYNWASMARMALMNQRPGAPLEVYSLEAHLVSPRS